MQKKEIDLKQKDNYHLKKIYSWEIFGIQTQTSNNSLSSVDVNKNKYECSVKYSWQIIGKYTQTISEDNFTPNDDYWQGSILFPQKNYKSQKKFNPNCRESSNSIRIQYCESTQTSNDKETETDFTDCRIKYSWENLIQQREKLNIVKLEDNQISYNFTNFTIQQESYKCCAKYSWENLINQHLNQK